MKPQMIQPPTSAPEQSAPNPPARLPAEETVLAVLPPLLGVLVGVIVLSVTALLAAGQAGSVTALIAGLTGGHSAWYMSRASAFAAYLLLWWSMVLGVTITNRLARVWPGGPTVGDLHEHASLLGLVFGMLHALVLLGDHYIGYTLPQILFPFASSNYEPLWVGLGQLSFYLMLLVTVSFYVRSWIGNRLWRRLHYLSYAVFGLALVHGLASGTDSATPWAFWMYVSTGLSLAGLTIYRIWVQRRLAAPTARANAR